MCDIGLMKTGELSETLEMIRSVFMQFEAPDYSQQGVDTFLDFIELSSIQKSVEDGEICFWIAKDGSETIGALAVRNKNHICMLFVDGQFHRRGIARRLLKEAFYDVDDSTEITVKSSPYAVPFYHAVGFVDTDERQTEDGIVFVPMARACGELEI